MVGRLSGLHQHASLSTEILLVNDEVILIVDDEESIREPLKTFFEEQGYPVAEAASAAECNAVLARQAVALILLDINLPDMNGLTLLPQIIEQHPDTAVIMLTGMANLHTALESIRNGADDYLAKPIQFREILFVVHKVLEKRYLLFENRKYHEELENAHFRIQLLHQLSMKMNRVYLGTVELDELLQAILVGITAEEGLRFNRAFLALFDDDGEYLQGRLAIGSACREEAGRTWANLRKKNLSFQDIIENLKNQCADSDTETNIVVKSIRVPVSETDHILIRSSLQRRSILVTDGKAEVDVDPTLLSLLNQQNFVIVPLFSPHRYLGVIIADHFVTNKPITQELINMLEVFASQASLAIDHSHLSMAMQHKINELEAMTHELDKNKDLLVEAERYATLGQMSAQLVHAIRNPITSIGGGAKLLARKMENDESKKFIDMMVQETAKLESTLEDLVQFAELPDIHKEEAELYPLIHKTVMLLQTTMQKQSVNCHLNLPEPGPRLFMDTRQIRQILLHLIKNGIEAMPGGGDLHLSVFQEGPTTSIVVLDSGLGMPESYLNMASEPFFTTKTYGTGLGLTMVKKIVEAHGGTLSFHRSENSGLEVSVRLPQT